MDPRSNNKNAKDAKKNDESAEPTQAEIEEAVHRQYELELAALQPVPRSYLGYVFSCFFSHGNQAIDDEPWPEAEMVPEVKKAPAK